MGGQDGRAVNIVLGALVAIGALLTAFVGATAFSLRSSDAAGNAMGEAWFAISVMSLWGLIGVALLIAAGRPPRHQLAWGTVNLATVLLFVGAAAGQLAALQVLSGHRSEGLYRLVVQLAVVVAPAAALVHVAWRGLGAPVSSSAATGAVAVVLAMASLAPAWGLLNPRRAAVAAAADPLVALAYPVVVLHNLAAIDVIGTVDELRGKSARYVEQASSPPFVIDSRLQIFVLRAGPGPGEFHLVDWEPDGTPEAARNILLRTKSFSADAGRDALDRERLAAETTLAGMIAVLRTP